jgi:hypothetical protein
MELITERFIGTGWTTPFEICHLNASNQFVGATRTQTAAKYLGQIQIFFVFCTQNVAP